MNSAAKGGTWPQGVSVRQQRRHIVSATFALSDCAWLIRADPENAVQANVRWFVRLHAARPGVCPRVD